MKALILLYHRVAYPGVDPWSLCVTPECFSEHMEALRRIANPCSLTELVRARVAGEVPDRAVAVTFDDGYLDNLTNGKPVLERHDVPATVFVCSGAVGRKDEFWWDELERALLQPNRKGQVRLVVKAGNELFTWSVADAARPMVPSDNTFLDDVGLSAYMRLCQILRPLNPEAQADAVRQIKAWAGLPEDARPTHRTMNVHEIAALAAGGLIEIGAHTVSHLLMPAHSREVQQSEILNSRSRLEEIVARPVSHFAFPFGEYDGTAVDILREAGFASACNSVAKGLTSRSGIYELPRLQIPNWGADEFIENLQRLLCVPEADLSFGERVSFPLEAFKRQTGELRDGAIECLPVKHRPGHCLFGADFTIAESGHYRVDIALEQELPDDVILDIYENRTIKRVLAEVQLEVAGASKLQLLEFSAESGNVVEFRVYWRGRSRLKIHGVHLERSALT